MSRGYLARVPNRLIGQFVQENIPSPFSPVIMSCCQGLSKWPAESETYISFTTWPTFRYHFAYRQGRANAFFGLEYLEEGIMNREIAQVRQHWKQFGVLILDLHPNTSLESQLRQLCASL